MQSASTRIRGELSGKKSPEEKFSREKYTTLLQNQNRQLQLRIKELQMELSALETKYTIEVERKRNSDEKALMYDEELRRRDRMIEEIAKTIADGFRHYKDVTTQENIPVVYKFSLDPDSPI